MEADSQNIKIDFGVMFRNVSFTILAVVLFIMRRSYSGPLEDLVHAYAGNVLVSFALYFVFVNPPIQLRGKRVLAAVLVLVIVESFEAFNGFGFMANTYDSGDFIANAVGVGFALGLDTILSRQRSIGSKIG